MKSMTQRLAVRMQRDRPMTTVSLRIPADLIGDLEEMAPLLGFSNYQALVRSYIGEGMRRDEGILLGEASTPNAWLA